MPDVAELKATGPVRCENAHPGKAGSCNKVLAEGLIGSALFTCPRCSAIVIANREKPDVPMRGLETEEVAHVSAAGIRT